MTPARPSPALLRSLTDEHVLRALTGAHRSTRAELAALTGISRPTVSESVRRLVGAGLLVDTGERTTGRGGVGSYYAVADGVGAALVVSIAPEGVVAERLDVHGAVTARHAGPVERDARPGQVARALRAVVARALSGSVGPARLAVVSAADPVDRATGALVHLPDAPFLVGELSPVRALAPLVDGPVTVDNDVSWAALAERRAVAAVDGSEPLDDVAYLQLGDGLGGAVVSDGRVRRGHGGLAGEVAHLVVPGPDGRARHLTDVFADLGLRRPGSTAVDGGALLAAVRGDERVRAVLAEALCGVLAALVALADPRLVVLGGRWGGEPVVVDAVRARAARMPRPVEVRAATVTVEPSLDGARQQALEDLRTLVVGSRPSA